MLGPAGAVRAAVRTVRRTSLNLVLRADCGHGHGDEAASLGEEEVRHRQSPLNADCSAVLARSTRHGGRRMRHPRSH